ncbi:MAG TPA: hypothetical protein VNC50_21470 [Planctomycetia bacterium]|jgi:hypothetical protein|nr:hypothetical protein [Planctomycetia bacterium]
MAAENALATLTERLDRLSGLLSALRREARSGCPDAKHQVPARIADVMPILVGRLKQARTAARQAVRFAQGGAGGVRLPLAEVERRLDRLLAEFRRVGGLPRLSDFADLRRRKRDWRDWAARVAAAQRQAHREASAAAKSVGACWRDLAERSTVGVTVNNVAVALAAPAPARRAAKAPGIGSERNSARYGGSDEKR